MFQAWEGSQFLLFVYDADREEDSRYQLTRPPITVVRISRLLYPTPNPRL